MWGKKENSCPIGQLNSLCWRLPIFPGGCPPSIFGTNELNYRVRDGNGWTLIVISTNCTKTHPRFKMLHYYTTKKMACQHFFEFFLIFFRGVGFYAFSNASSSVVSTYSAFSACNCAVCG